MTHTKIVLYTSPGCPDCAAVKRYLGDRELAFEERDITIPGVADEAKARYGVRIAPITVIGNTFFMALSPSKKQSSTLPSTPSADQNLLTSIRRESVDIFPCSPCWPCSSSEHG
ncbi:MAG: glutaredoxin family protein [Acidithiobacillus sp.]|nr:glutaredoxin family protein [Acidithiobacillus sp.]